MAAEGSDLSHHGDLGDEDVVIVVEEPHRAVGAPAKAVRAPRMPTQADVDALVATHPPHADWCEICIKGQGRNSPHEHTKKKREPGPRPGSLSLSLFFLIS